MQTSEFTLIQTLVGTSEMSEIYHVQAADKPLGYVFKRRRKRFWGYGHLGYKSECIFQAPEDAALALALWRESEARA